MNEIHFLTGGSLLFSCPLNIEKRMDISWLVMLIYEHIGQSIIKMVYRIEISSFFIYFAMQESVKFASQMSTVSSLCISGAFTLYQPYIAGHSCAGQQGWHPAPPQKEQETSPEAHGNPSHYVSYSSQRYFQEFLFPRWILMPMETLTSLRTRWRVVEALARTLSLWRKHRKEDHRL